MFYNITKKQMGCENCKVLKRNVLKQLEKFFIVLYIFVQNGAYCCWRKVISCCHCRLSGYTTGYARFNSVFHVRRIGTMVLSTDKFFLLPKGNVIFNCFV